MSRHFNRTSTPNLDGSGYHPLDINRDGQVNVADIVTATTEGLPTIVGEMILKYYQNENPYDLDNDGLVTDNDINIAMRLGVPTDIIIDMRDNKDTVAIVHDSTSTGPYVEENLVSRGNEFRLLNGMIWSGPYHCYHNGDVKIYKTEANPSYRYSRLMFPIESVNK